MQRSMRVDIHAYKTKEIVWEVHVKAKDCPFKGCPIIDSLVAKTKEFHILHRRHRDFVAESGRLRKSLLLCAHRGRRWRHILSR